MTLSLEKSMSVQGFDTYISTRKEGDIEQAVYIFLSGRGYVLIRMHILYRIVTTKGFIRSLSATAKGCMSASTRIFPNVLYQRSLRFKGDVNECVVCSGS